MAVTFEFGFIAASDFNSIQFQFIFLSMKTAKLQISTCAENYNHDCSNIAFKGWVLIEKHREGGPQ